jgi:hypothetical protein
MTRGRLSTLLGAATALLSTLIVLAGSDVPPPPGFLAVVLVAAALGLVVRLVVPGLLTVRDERGTAAALMRAGALAAGTGCAVGALFMLFSPGEPSVSTDVLAGAVFLFVLAAVGAVGGLAVTTLAILADRAHTRAGAVSIVAAPLGLTMLLTVVVIGMRLG